MRLDTMLGELRPTRGQWRTWGVQEPVLAGIDYPTLRHELRHGSQRRTDELLASLARIARREPAAGDVLTACMWPGLRGAVKRHAPGLDYEEAVAIAVAGLHEAVMRFPVAGEPVPCFVASRLLRIPKRRLRSAVLQQKARRERPCAELVPRLFDGRDVELSIAALLRTAVAAGVIHPADAWLLWSVDGVGHSLGFAARHLAIGYDAARQRRNRAARRWQAWWFGEVESDKHEEAVA